MSAKDVVVKEGLKWVTVGSTRILGFMGLAKDREVTGMKVEEGVPAEKTFREFFMRKAMGRLLTIEVGEGKDIISVQLSEEEHIKFDMVKAQWEAACRQSAGWLACQVFEDMFGGK